LLNTTTSRYRADRAVTTILQSLRVIGGWALMGIGI
jgi:hypothetical protein